MIRSVPVAKRCGQPLPVRLAGAAELHGQKGFMGLAGSGLSDLRDTISAAITTAVAVTAQNLDTMYG
jgi:hypothetical protein